MAPLCAHALPSLRCPQRVLLLLGSRSCGRRRRHWYYGEAMPPAEKSMRVSGTGSPGTGRKLGPKQQSGGSRSPRRNRSKPPGGGFNNQPTLPRCDFHSPSPRSGFPKPPTHRLCRGSLDTCMLSRPVFICPRHGSGTSVGLAGPACPARPRSAFAGRSLRCGHPILSLTVTDPGDDPCAHVYVTVRWL